MLNILDFKMIGYIKSLYYVYIYLSLPFTYVVYLCRVLAAVCVMAYLLYYQKLLLPGIIIIIIINNNNNNKYKNSFFFFYYYYFNLYTPHAIDSLGLRL